MLAMFGVLRSSIAGSSTASKITQAEARGVVLMESIRQAPNAALVCLTLNSASHWSNCETICKQALAHPSTDACAYTMASTGQPQDRNGQSYAVDAASVVQAGGTNGTVYDVTLVIGWNDDGSTTPTPPGQGYHTLTLRTAVSP
jgi:hypothetical protein